MKVELPDNPEVIQDAINRFSAPIGFRLIIPQGKTASIIDEYGVRVVPTYNEYHNDMDENGKHCIWYCLASRSCRLSSLNRKLKGTTSNATQHLKKFHHVKSSKTINTEIRKQRNLTKFEELRDCDLDPERKLQLFWTTIITNKFLPFNFFQSDETRVLYMANSICENPTYILDSKKVKHRIVEIYNFVRITIKQNLGNYIGGPLPRVSLSVDTWSSKVTQEKFLGIRVFYINNNVDFTSHLLAIKPINISYELRVNNTIKFSKMLAKWVEEVLLAYGLKVADIYSATTDFGPDVKRIFRNEIPLPSLWCIPHLLNRVLADAIGTNINITDLHRSRHPQCLEQIKAIKSIPEYLKKSDIAKTCLKEYSDINLTIKSFSPSRFMGVKDLLERTIKLWDSLREVYYCQNKHWPIENKQIVEHLYYVIKPAASLIQIAQSHSASSSIRVLYELIKLRRTSCNINEPLKVTFGDNKCVYFSHNELHPIARKTREILIEGIDNRFFKRYFLSNVANEDFLLEQAAFLHPSLKSLRMLNDITILINDDENFATEIIKGKIKNNILKKMKLFEKPKPKKLKKKKNPYEDYELLNMISGDGLDEEHGHQNVNKEMEKYLNLNISLSEVSMDGSDLLTWWKSSRLSFPILFKVAMSILTLRPDACYLEGDFSTAKEYLTLKRSRTDGSFVDMSMVNSKNANLIEWNAIKEIPASDVSNFIPRFIMDNFRISSNENKYPDIRESKEENLGFQSDCYNESDTQMMEDSPLSDSLI